MTVVPLAATADGSPPDRVVIDVEGLTKSFGDHLVVDGFSIQVERGRIQGFLGPNGSGKTTTIRMLCGLLTPDGGRGSCLGHDILTEAEMIKARVGYMTQKFSFYEDLTIRENLDFVARIHRLDRRRERVAQALEDLGLATRRNQLAGSLSGGWKQRLALSACLLHDPDLLLLDEPTAGVDPKARREFWDHINQLADGGLTVLVSTHYMDEAERCHEISYLAYGRLLAKGTVEDVVREAGLTIWSVSGSGVRDLARDLRAEGKVEMVTAFGNALHLGGQDRAALETALAPYRNRPGLTWKPAEAELEDVFIHLMSRAEDSYR
ncbi:MAG: ABC transporter ATP-binding protein [Rhodospirillum sp.]|nr:ABC transporter ATP-binding protein [Rhodospirillum sp.]MCF8488817.1 ABC transporter ATP-binding protein [Rhodospirillum sp.]MCF8500899.1 ABC transporter ATP-binding protein [Rhodospirillum sp.]